MRIKKIKRDKRCQSCQELFQPNLRTKGKQKYCSKKDCQKKRQRKNEKGWRKKNPECVQLQYEQTRQWFNLHPEYSAQRRAKNPQLLENNRNQTRKRMEKSRRKQLFDKSKVILTQVVGSKLDKCYLARGGSWLFVRLTKASPLSKLRRLGHTLGAGKSVVNRLPQGRLYEMHPFFES